MLTGSHKGDRSGLDHADHRCVLGDSGHYSEAVFIGESPLVSYVSECLYCFDIGAAAAVLLLLLL